MSSIYLHIPYCKKLCYYCDFHFSLNLKTKSDFVDALCNEIELQKSFLQNSKTIETIYFGGGTPSVLSKEEISKILLVIYRNWEVSSTAEISFECNPDDLTEEYLRDLYDLGINRLSIGIQSFSDDELEMLNRRHNSKDAVLSVERAQKIGFTNITIDLIYGLPHQTLSKWKNNLSIAKKLNVQHISAYALSVEKNTALFTFIRTGKIVFPKDEHVISHFNYLIEWAKNNGFEQYEISNFARNGMYSKHNSNYWKSKPYLGLGPSAHSYDGTSRYWNISNNLKYINSLQKDILPNECEELRMQDIYNEYIMTGLRTKWGVDTELIKKQYPKEFFDTFTLKSEKFCKQGLMKKNQNSNILTQEGIIISDTIISDFFIV